jgi:hypothetical protein
MRRPSIFDPRIPTVSEHAQPEQVAPLARGEIGRDFRPSLLVELPVETRTINSASAKRKCVDDVSARRVTRPRLSDDGTASRKPAAPGVGQNGVNEENPFARHAPLVFDDEVPVPLSPTRKTYGKQKAVVNRPAQQVVPQADSSRPEQPNLPVAEPAVSVAVAVKSRKTASKPKSKSKPAPAQEQASPDAAPSNSKKAPYSVKKEAKGSRQPVGACKSCRSRHVKCDRTQPICGRCVKSGTSCEYPQAPNATAQNVAPAPSPKKKHALLPTQKSANEAGRVSKPRGRSVTVSPEAPRQKGPAERPVSTSPSKKSMNTAAPTAASSRAPRAKNTRTLGASPRKK